MCEQTYQSPCSHRIYTVTWGRVSKDRNINKTISYNKYFPASLSGIKTRETAMACKTLHHLNITPILYHLSNHLFCSSLWLTLLQPRLLLCSSLNTQGIRGPCICQSLCHAFPPASALFSPHLQNFTQMSPSWWGLFWLNFVKLQPHSQHGTTCSTSLLVFLPGMCYYLTVNFVAASL